MGRWFSVQSAGRYGGRHQHHRAAARREPLYTRCPGHAGEAGNSYAGKTKTDALSLTADATVKVQKSQV